ncbi:MAG: ABC transporter permease [Erysipelotrichaceae bacterium]|nr:ABC transporter permease [Erysipelotrichaceae bacterium]
MNKLITILRKPITGTLIAILLGFVCGGLILGCAGYNPASALQAMVEGVIGRPKYVANILVKSTPIILTGCSVAFAYKMGLFNIGAEGQYIFGAMAACLTGILLDLNPWIQIPLVFLAGTLAGALYGALSGWLKARFNIHEVISGIMLNWIAMYFSNWVVNLDAFHKPNTSGTFPINDSGMISFFTSWRTTPEAVQFMKTNPFFGDLLRTDLNPGFIVAVILVLLAADILYKTSKGYQLRAVGSNKYAAEFAGINVKKNIVHTMFFAGALSGAAAALAIMGNNPHAIMTLAAFEGNGLNGLSVAFIANGSPVGCIFSGLLFGGLLYGGQNLQYVVGAPSEIVNIMIGTIVFFVALKDVIPMIAEWLEHKNASKKITASNEEVSS